MYINNRSGERRTQAERRAVTRRALLGAAQGLFAERGYHGVAAEEIVGRAGVTRGAMYHHFGDKRGLFRVVVEEIEGEVDELVLEAARAVLRESGDPFEAWMAGLYASLDVYCRPDVRRIQLVDGPAVLSMEEWREIDAAHAVAKIKAGLELLMDRAVIERQPVGPLAHILHGATTEAAMYVAFSEDPERAREEMGVAFRRLLKGL
jgi:AcrR family transcriptional regulator